MISSFVLLEHHPKSFFKDEEFPTILKDQFDIYLILPSATLHPLLLKFIKDQKEYLNRFNLLTNLSQLSTQQQSNISHLVIVDTKRLSRIKHLFPILFTVPYDSNNPNNTSDSIIVNKNYKEKKKNLSSKTILCGSATSIIVKKIKKFNEQICTVDQQIQLSSLDATVISMGIYEDTGNFTYPTTSQIDFQSIDVDQNQKQQQQPDIPKTTTNNNQIENNNDQEEAEIQKHYYNLLNEIEQTISLCEIIDKNNVKYEIFISEIISDRFIQNISPVVQYYIKKKGFHNFICFHRFSEGIVIICRSSNSFPIDFGQICEHLGGGGHQFASSVTLKDFTLPEVRSMVINLIYGQLIGRDLKVGQFMSLNPITIPIDSTIYDAKSIFQENSSIRNLVVVDGESKKVVGQIDKNLIYCLSNCSDLDCRTEQLKDHFSDLSKFPNSFKSDSIQDTITTMEKNRQWMVPIVEQDTILPIGVFTSTDLLNMFRCDSENQSTRRIKEFGKRLEIPDETLKTYKNWMKDIKDAKKELYNWIGNEENRNLSQLYSILNPLSLECILILMSWMLHKDRKNRNNIEEQYSEISNNIFLKQAPFSLFFNYFQLNLSDKDSLQLKQ
eukprot:gene982-1248_t